MPIHWLTNNLKARPLTRDLYRALRDWKFKVSDSLKINTLVRQFRGHEILVVKSRDCGFFSNFFQAVGGIYLARKNNQRVVFQFDNGPYFDPERSEESWWSYYFQPSNPSIWISRIDESSEQSVCIVEEKEDLNQMSRTGSRFGRHAGHQLLSEFALQKTVDDAVQAFKQTHFSNHFMIGLHYRGTDKVENGLEANRVDYSMIDETLNIIATLNIPFRLFVATDEEPLIRHLDGREAFELVYTNSLRSSNKEPVHLSENRLSKYQLGFDALLDAVLLSQCDLLLRTESNLSRASEFFNPNMESINLSVEFAYSTPDWTKPRTPNKKLILEKVASAYRRKQSLSEREESE